MMSGWGSEKGIFVLSLDLELAWGSFDLWGLPDAGIPRSSYERLLRTRQTVIDALLGLLQEYRIPATWAIVGHLFLDRCEARNGKKHPEMPRPVHRWFGADWYAWDPASDLERDPLWYGRDIVEKIRACEPQQDIGCHSFSHAIFGDEGCSAEVAEAEIARCVTLAREMDIELKSFVFPRSQEGHHQILKDYGFSCYRESRPGWFTALGTRGQRLARFTHDLLGFAPACASVRERLPQLWSISSTTYYRPAYGAGSLIPVRSRIRQGIRGITKAIRTQGISHICLHPRSLGTNTSALVTGLAEILAFADRKRREGKLEMLSMAQLAGRLAATQAGIYSRDSYATGRRGE